MSANLNEKGMMALIWDKLMRIFYAEMKNFKIDNLENILKDEEKFNHLAEKIKNLFNELLLLWELLCDYVKGNYPSAPAQLIAAIGVTIAYLISPLDIIPDPLPCGFLDDTALFAFILRAFQADIDKYRSWKKAKEAAPQE